MQVWAGQWLAAYHTVGFLIVCKTWGRELQKERERERDYFWSVERTYKLSAWQAVIQFGSHLSSKCSTALKGHIQKKGNGLLLRINIKSMHHLNPRFTLLNKDSEKSLWHVPKIWLNFHFTYYSLQQLGLWKTTTFKPSIFQPMYRDPELGHKNI